jgi:hypothetical protein
MFPTYDIVAQRTETVGERKARKAIKAQEEDVRRPTPARSHSSGSIKSVTTNTSKSRTADQSGFGWFGKSSKKRVQEISTLPALKEPQHQEEPEPELWLREIEPPCPPTAPLPPLEHERDLSRRSSNRSNYDYHSPSPELLQPPPSRALPSLPHSLIPPGPLKLAGMFPLHSL